MKIQEMNQEHFSNHKICCFCFTHPLPGGICACVWLCELGAHVAVSLLIVLQPVSS